MKKTAHRKASRKSFALFNASIDLLESRVLFTTYYVSPTGNDTNAGTSPAAAWATVAKVNGSTFDPGDTILFQRGATFNESLHAPNSGTVNSPITFGAYGDSTLANPLFDGADTLDPSTFTLLTGTTYTLNDATTVNWLFEDHAFLQESQDAIGGSTPDQNTDPTTNINYVEANSGTFYYDSATTTLYVNIGGALTGHVISAAVRQDGVSNFNATTDLPASNLIFDDLDVTETAADNGGYGFRDQNGDNVTFENCTATNTGKHAFGAISDNNFTGLNLTSGAMAPNQGFGGASAFVSFAASTTGAPVSNLNNTWINCTYIDGNVGYQVFTTHGDPGSIASIDLINMKAAVSAGLELEATSTSETISVTGGNLGDSVIALYTDNSVINGVTFDSSYAGVDLEGGGDVVENCLFTNLTPDVPSGHNGAVVDYGYGAKNVVRFNTFDYANGPAVTWYNSSATTQIYGNIFDTGSLSLYSIYPDTPSVTSDYNIFGPTTTVGSNYISESIQSWQAAGFDAHSIVADPQFVDPATGDFQLSQTSPAIDFYTATVDSSIAPFSSDIAGNPRYYGNGYDDGAYELQSPKVSITGSLSVTGSTAPVPLPGTTSATEFTVTLSSAQTNTVTVDYTTVDGTATAGTDYTATSGTLTFDPGVTSQVVNVEILSALAADTTKAFSLQLSNPTLGITLSSSTATTSVTNTSETTSTFTRKTPLTYTDSSGQKIVVKLAGAGTGTALFLSSGSDPAEMLLTGTTAASSLTVSTPKLQTAIGELIVQGSIGGVTINGDTDGNISVSGTLGHFTAGSIAADTLILVQGTAGRSTYHLGAMGANLESAEAISSLVATNWSSGVLLATPSVSTLSVKGAFGANVSLTSAAVALGSAHLGSIAGGTWNITGRAAAVTTTTTDSSWAANFSGGLTSLAVTSALAGTINASSIHAISVHGSVDGANLNLSSTAMDLASLVVTGAVNGSTIRATGNLGNITVGAAINSLFFAGVSSTVSTLPASTDFTGNSTITSFTTTAPAADSTGFENSDVAAATITRARVRKVTFSNNGISFGLAAHTLKSFSDIETGQKPFNWTSRQSTSLLTFTGDFKVAVE